MHEHARRRRARCATARGAPAACRRSSCDRQSRQARRNSWRGEPGDACAGRGSRRGRLLGDQRRGRCPRGCWRRCRRWRRSSSSVPSAISRPPAMTPMRSAMRSATSRMCVVMMTVPPARDALAQHVLDLARGAGVEAGQRLVEDDQARVVHQRAGERHLLAHALGEALAALVRVRREAEPVDQLARARLGDRRRRCPTGRRRIRDIRTASACRRSSARRRPRP